MSGAPTLEAPAKPKYSCLGKEAGVSVVKPGAKVWTEPMPEREEEQAAFFRREGFLVLRGVLSRAELDELDAEVARMVREHHKLPRIREGFDLEPNQDAKRATPTFRKIGGMSDLSGAFHDLMCHPRITRALRMVMGPVIELYRDVLMMKPARVGREKPWHQDSVYWPWNPMDLCSAMTALDDAAPENGCLQVIPRTHLKEIQHYGRELQIDLTEEQQANTHYVPLKAGDTLLFHSLLLHGSEPNRSEQDRRVAILSYKTPGLKFIGKGEAPKSIVIHDVKPFGYV
ncbi:MAG: phytanoyl-CoA dioxygenase family protein [Planctomycetota bacterium]|nr:phytanoyl-CoA dioxygenase family protein [Planctomycetota bacterium]